MNTIDKLKKNRKIEVKVIGTVARCQRSEEPMSCNCPGPIGNIRLLVRLRGRPKGCFPESKSEGHKKAEC